MKTNDDDDDDVDDDDDINNINIQYSTILQYS